MNNIQKYFWLKRALKHYKRNTHCGLCLTLKETSKVRIINNSKITDYIPEYNPEFFGTTVLWNGYWWDRADVTSRINALEKLIKIYRKKVFYF